MGLFSFSKKKPKRDVALCLDIGSANIGASLIALYPGTIIQPEVISSSRKDIPFTDELNFDDFLIAMTKTLHLVLLDIHKKAKGVPEKAFVVLASPWYASETKKIHYSKDTPFTFTKEIWDALLKDEVKHFEDEHMSKYKHIGDHARLLEKKNIKVYLNGYDTENPVGKKTKTLDLSLYLSMSPLSILSLIHTKIQSVFAIDKIRFSSFLYASFVVFRDMISESKDFICIDVGGEVTDIAIIKDDAIVDSVSFPLGKNALIRSLSKSLKVSPPDVLSLFALYSSGRCEDKIKNKIESALAKIQSEWLSHFQKGLMTMKGELEVPNAVFITADKDVGEWFRMAVENDEFGQYALSERKFNAILIDGSILNRYVTWNGELESDPFIMLETIFISRNKIL